MIAIHFIQDMTSVLTHAAHWVDSAQLFQGQLPFDLSLFDAPVLAQNVRQTDLIGDIQKWFDHVAKTGQGWAFLLGLIAGYMVKTFTTFG